MKPIVKLKSKSETIKWPRYEILLDPGLNYKQAMQATYAALRSTEKERLLLSQFSYNPDTGIVDTRVNRENFNQHAT